MLRESLRMSLSNIRGNKMRSFLTVLGIIIEVLGDALQNSPLRGIADTIGGLIRKK